MIRELKLKHDFEKTIERFEAWWVGEIIDRPPICVSVKPTRPYTGPTKTHPTHRDRWLDVEFVVDCAIARMEQSDYVGDSFPVFFPNLGPEISATPFGCELEFSKGTSWSIPIVKSPDQWERIIEMTPNFDNIYWQAVDRLTDYAIERCEGRYIVGITDLHDSYDTLAALRDPQMLCTDLIDCPDLVRRAGRHLADAYVQSFNRSYEKLSAAGFGSSTWLNVYHEGPAYVPSCDFWCMVRPETAREMILPDLLLEIEPLERSIFHLDGPQALTHLDLVLDIPQLHALQWVWGAGNGPAARWIDVYRRTRQAGKSLQLIAEDPDDAMTVLTEIGLEGVWITVRTPFDTIEQAEHFFSQVQKVTRP